MTATSICPGEPRGCLCRALKGTSFHPMSMWSHDFNYSIQGWRVEQHPRMLGDVNGDGKHDLVGFGNYGVWVATAK